MDEGFLAEARYYRSKAEESLSQLEQAPDNFPALVEVYLSTHAAKSDAEGVGYLHFAQIVRSVEDIFGDALDEVAPLDKSAFELLHRSLERVNLLLEVMKMGNGDAGRIVAENFADHMAFRQHLLSRPSRRYADMTDAEIRQWPPGDLTE